MEQQQEEQQGRDDLTGPLALGTLGVATVADLIVKGGWVGAGAGALAAAFVYFGGTPYIRAARRMSGVSHLFVNRQSSEPGGSRRSVVDRLLNFPGEDARSRENTARIGDEQIEDLQPKPRPQLAPPAALRAPSQAKSYFTLSDVLRKGFRPSLQKIYLVTLEDGTDVFVQASKLCHVALAGLTRGGKGHIKRSLMAQLCYAGAEVYSLDPHYTRWDRESEDPTGKPCPEDWTPYTPYLGNDPAEQIPTNQKFQVIEHYIKELHREFDRRMELYGRSQSVGRPMFIFIDELPVIVRKCPEVPAILASLLQEGAKVGVFLVCASQNYHVKTVFPDEGGAVRDCFRTVFYVGGDATTASVLLDMKASGVPENRMGKGCVMLRCDSVRPAQIAFVPYVDNQALYALLGPSTYVEPREDERQMTGPQLRPATACAQDNEVHTDKPPAVRSGTRTVRSAVDRRIEREQRLRSVAPVQARLVARAPEVPVQDDPESGLADDERAVLEAYRAGYKSGNAIAGITRLPGTRVNKHLNRLSALRLIDWQPKA